MAILKNIIPFMHKRPNIDKTAYINPYAIIIGDVTIQAGASLWPGVTIRANDEHVEIGKNTAILDRSFIDAPQGKPVDIANDVLISHGAMLQGCKIAKGVLIGKNVSIQDGAEIGEESVIVANTYISPDTKIPPRSKVAGVPGKVAGKVTENEIYEVRKKHTEIMEKALEYGQWFVTKKA